MCRPHDVIHGGSERRQPRDAACTPITMSRFAALRPRTESPIGLSTRDDFANAPIHRHRALQLWWVVPAHPLCTATGNPSSGNPTTAGSNVGIQLHHVDDGQFGIGAFGDGAGEGKCFVTKRRNRSRTECV